ncbi:unnamed protein product [Arctogadus glacialis]
MPFDLDRNIRHTLCRLQTGLRTTDGGDGDDGGGATASGVCGRRQTPAPSATLEGEEEGTAPGVAPTSPTVPRRPCSSHVSISTVGRRVRLGHVSGVAGCQNAVPWDTAEGFSAQRARLWREGGGDGI